MPKITCTDKQLQIIKAACEIYGRVQIHQFIDLADLIAEAEYPYLEDDKVESDAFRKHIEFRNDLQDALNKFDWAYGNRYGKYPDNAQIALDVWAVLDGRREGSDFAMGSEPLIKVEADND